MTSTGADLPGASTCSGVNDLLKDLRDKLQPFDKSKEEYNEKIKSLKYKKIDNVMVCEALQGIQVKNFKKYIENLQKRHKLPDKARQSFHDAMISDGKYGSANDFNLSENGEITMFFLECIVTKQNEKIDLAFATYNLSFKIQKEKETSSKKISFSMNKDKKDAFCKLYQKELYDCVDQKCKSEEKTES
jgi:hypothetical protein